MFEAYSTVNYDKYSFSKCKLEKSHSCRGEAKILRIFDGVVICAKFKEL